MKIGKLAVVLLLSFMTSACLDEGTQGIKDFMIGKFTIKDDMIYAYGDGKLISFNWKNAMSL